MIFFLFQKKVFFSAQKTNPQGDFSGRIIYDKIDINFGNGLQTNGKFIAPEDGTYGFTFSALSGNERSYTEVQVNAYGYGFVHHYIYDGNNHGSKNINSSWMMRLAKGQEVFLEITNGKLWADSIRPVIFTGNLLMLDE